MISALVGVIVGAVLTIAALALVRLVEGVRAIHIYLDEVKNDDDKT